jgi:hypothetical protein
MFKSWTTEIGDKVLDNLDITGEVMIDAGDGLWCILSVTDIKRLMMCVEQWERAEKNKIKKGGN